jgi:hypothetical protein
MRCDQNHAWWRLLAGCSEPAPDDLVCPVDQSPAVTAGRRELADRVSIRLIPATWEHEGAVGFEGQFFIEISDLSGVRSLRSGQAFELDEACRRIGWFNKLTWIDAERRWNRTGMQKIDVLKGVAQGSVSGET